MLKPVESFWSYVSDWILMETRPGCNKMQVIYSGFIRWINHKFWMSEVLEIVLFFSVPIWGRHKTNPTQTWLSVLESSELRWVFVKKQRNEGIIFVSLKSTVLYKIPELPALLPSLQCISLAPVLKQLHKKKKKKCNLSCRTSSNCCTWKRHRHPWTTCWGDTTSIQRISANKHSRPQC